MIIVRQHEQSTIVLIAHNLSGIYTPSNRLFKFTSQTNADLLVSLGGNEFTEKFRRHLSTLRITPSHF